MNLKSLLFSLLFAFICSLSINAQVYFSDNFNDQDLSNWTQHDLDGDTKVWQTFNFEQVIAHFGSGTLISFSKEFGGDTEYDPDNLIVSPLIDLTNASPNGLILSFEGIGDYDINDRYAVYLTESNNPQDIIASTPLINEETIAEFKKEINLSSYVGKKWYLSFRHFNSKGKAYVGIDNLEIKIPQDNMASLESIFIEGGMYHLPNNPATLELTLKNKGQNNITAVKVNWNDGTDHIAEINTNIQPGMVENISHPIKINYSDVSQHFIKTTITEVNGVTNSNTTDNYKEFSFTTISKSAPKKVLIEEGTGTWCGFCPRGIILMKHLDENLSDKAIGIAVHTGNDPMKLPEYESGSTFSSAPSIHGDRDYKSINLTKPNLEGVVNDLYNTNSPADLEITGNLNGMDLTFNLKGTFYSNFSASNFRFGVIIAENNVKGTDSSYDQANYYSGQNQEMGGYENLPNPVPAAQMIYDHVGRALIGGYNGQEGSIPNTLSNEQISTYSFNYKLPDGTDYKNFYAVGVIIDNETGVVVNSRKLPISNLSIDEVTKNKIIKIYPNPADEMINIKINNTDNYTLSIYNIAGKLVAKQKIASGKNTISYNVSNLAKGVYIVSLSTENKSYSEKLVIK